MLDATPHGSLPAEHRKQPDSTVKRMETHEETAAGRASARRTLALDVGKARIGVAITDGLGYTAQPLLTIWRKSPGNDMRSLLRLIRKHDVAEIVVGNPMHLEGGLLPFAAKVQALAAELAKRSGVPVHLFDERLTTVEAHSILDAAGHATHGRKAVIDQVAAVVILRDWMQTRQHEEAKRALGDGDPA